VAKILVVNVLVLVALLFILNLSAVLIYNAYQTYKTLAGYFAPEPIRREILLPNYEHIEWAAQHFIELEEVERKYKSFIGWRTLPYQGQTINIDESGIRNTPQSGLVAEDAPNVVFLGGSTMWGVGVNDENTIPAHFIDVSQMRFRAVNLGVIGYNALQSFIFLKLQMLDGLEPDIIISYDGVNEFSKYRKGLGPYAHSREAQIRDRVKGIDTQIIEPLKLRNFFLGPIESLISKIIDMLNITTQESAISYDLSQERTERIAKELLDSWLSIKDLADQNDIIFIAILQPNVATGNPKIDHLEGYLNADFIEVELSKMLYPKVVELMNSPKYQELKNNFLDLTSAFDVDEYIYIDWHHVSPNGNRIIAEHINEHINLLIKDKEVE